MAYRRVFHSSFNRCRANDLIPYSQQTITISDAIYVAYQVKFKSLTQGKEIEKFENAIAKYVGARFAVAVSSATAGLHLSHLALELPVRSKIATSPISFVASANSIIYAGHEPIFIDVEASTGNISFQSVLSSVELNSIKAIVPVHYGGNPCAMEAISKLCVEKDIKIIEDAAHALGSQYETGEMVGSCKYSDITVFSFHPVKSITTGEGGVITTNSSEIYSKLLKLRSHGIEKSSSYLSNEILSVTNKVPNPWYYEMNSLGFHYRMTEIQAALGYSQLKKIGKFLDKRRKLAMKYDLLLKNQVNVNRVNQAYRKISANHLYSIQINFANANISRNELMVSLKGKGISSQIHYMPIPLHPYYEKLGYRIDDLPNALDFYFKTLSLPLYPRLSRKKQLKVVRALREILG